MKNSLTLLSVFYKKNYINKKIIFLKLPIDFLLILL